MSQNANIPLYTKHTNQRNTAPISAIAHCALCIVHFISIHLPAKIELPNSEFPRAVNDMAQTPSKPKKTNLHEGHRQRLKEHILTHSPETLNEHQLLEALLFYSIPRIDTNPIAHELLFRFGSLNELFHADAKELKKVKGVTDNTVALLRLIPAIMRQSALSREQAEIISSTAEAAEFFAPYFEGIHEERIYLLSLNQRHQVVGCDLLSKGGQSQAIFDITEMARIALTHHAVSVLLAHNHPSGCCFPSDADMSTTRQCEKLLQLMHIHLEDHLVFGDDGYLSIMRTHDYN